MQATVFQGEKGVRLYITASLRAGLRLYVKTGMRPKWTPKAMLAKASELTGKSYGRGQYEEAIKDLTTILENRGE